MNFICLSPSEIAIESKNILELGVSNRFTLEKCRGAKFCDPKGQMQHPTTPRKHYFKSVNFNRTFNQKIAPWLQIGIFKTKYP